MIYSIRFIFYQLTIFSNFYLFLNLLPILKTSITFDNIKISSDYLFHLLLILQINDFLNNLPFYELIFNTIISFLFFKKYKLFTFLNNTFKI